MQYNMDNSGNFNMYQSEVISLMKKSKKQLIFGCPDNPNSKAGDLFRGGNYLMCFQGGFEKFSILLSNGGVIELHFQLFSEVPDPDKDDKINKSEFDKIANYVKTIRKKNIDLMSHLPFMIDKKAEAKINNLSLKSFDGFFNFDFCWFVIPESYRMNPTVIPAFVAQSKDDKTLFARKTELDDVFRTIDLLDKFDVELLTVHATKPGIFFTSGELDEYKNTINKINDYIKSKNSNVEICVETGGLLPNELIEINRDCNVNINMDIAHFLLDLSASKNFKSNEEMEKYTLNFIKENTKIIKNMHLTQTYENIDAHKGVYENGIISCNGEVIKFLNNQYQKGNKILSMVESKPDYRNFEFVYHTLNDDVNPKKKQIKSRSSLILVMGTAASGKSTIRKFLENDSIISIESDKVHEEILASAESLTAENFNEEVRQIGYNTILHYISNFLDEGLEVIVDATFDKKKRRKQLFDILKKRPKNDVYIIKVESNDVKTKEIDPAHSFGGAAIEKRKKEAEDISNDGKPLPFVLRDFYIYKNLIDKYEPFDISEYSNAHFTYINTGDNTFKIYNENTKQKIMLSIIKEGYKKMGISLNEI